MEGANGLSVSSERHWQSGVNGIEKFRSEVPLSCENLSGREKLSASRDFTVCIIRCVYRAELILGR